MEPLGLWLFSPNAVQVFRDRLDIWHAWKGEGGEARTEIWCGKLSDRGHLENLGVDDRVILQWILMKLDGGADWVELVQDRDK